MKKYIYTLLFLAQIFPLILLGQTSIMSYNIRYDNPSDNENSWENRKNEVAGLIEYYHPDFLGIQEGLYKQVDFIQKNTSNYKYIGVGRDGSKKGEYSAIYYDITKFELITQNTFWLSNRPNKISIGWDAALPRICTYGKFKNKLTNDSIHIFNAHFDHIGVKARKKAAKLILEKIIEYKLNNAVVIVMGDLNSTPMSEPVAIFSKKLDYGFKNSLKKFYGPLGTFNGFNNCLEIKKRIDYIFTKNITVLSYRHIDDKRVNNLCISDHIPVLVEIKNTTANNVYN
ncbi:MAG: endonuclease/exonuclease/phosphatase family protein [Polaribacter sp.]|uniref:endonuclease/exonuclease/phosphatase family protein n=1 Tax=Polaribacter sp. TaxID=1920175 RepID=UPI002F360C50